MASRLPDKINTWDHVLSWSLALKQSAEHKRRSTMRLVNRTICRLSYARINNEDLEINIYRKKPSEEVKPKSTVKVKVLGSGTA